MKNVKNNNTSLRKSAVTTTDKSFLSWVGNASMQPMLEVPSCISNDFKVPLASNLNKLSPPPSPMSPSRNLAQLNRRVGRYTCTNNDGQVKQREKIFRIIREMDTEFGSDDEDE